MATSKGSVQASSLPKGRAILRKAAKAGRPGRRLVVQRARIPIPTIELYRTQARGAWQTMVDQANRLIVERIKVAQSTGLEHAAAAATGKTAEVFPLGQGAVTKLLRLAKEVGKDDFLALCEGRLTSDEILADALCQDRERERTKAWQLGYEQGRLLGKSVEEADQDARQTDRYKVAADVAGGARRKLAAAQERWLPLRSEISLLKAKSQLEPNGLWDVARGLRKTVTVEVVGMPVRQPSPIEVMAKSVADLAKAVAERTPHVDVHVEAPVVNLPAPRVTVEIPPIVRIDPAVLQVNQIPAQVDVHVPAPVVNVEAPVVNVTLPEQPLAVVQIPPPPRKTVVREFERDEEGLITRSTEREE